MKECSACHRVYTDDTLVYCLDDGTLLAQPYDPGATLIVPPPRLTNPPAAGYVPQSPVYAQPREKRSYTWIVVALGAALLLLVLSGGGLIAWLSLREQSQPQQSSNSQDQSSTTNTGKKGKDDSASDKNVPSAQQLVGVWRTNVTELGVEQTITYTFDADGTCHAVFKDSRGRTGTDTGSWQYSDGILHERFSNGATGTASITWIDHDTLVVTIIDNGVPAYTGLKRTYHRMT